MNYSSSDDLTCLVAGVDLNLANIDGETALIDPSAARNQDPMVSEKCTKLLPQAGAGVDIKDYFGQKALGKPAWNGHINCVEMLLKSGACVNIKDKRGATPLILASAAGRAECVKKID